MKNKYHIAILVAVLAVFASGLANAQSLSSVYRQAVTQYDNKQYAEALILFERILKVSPRYTPALSYKNKCVLALKGGSRGNNQMEAKLKTVKLPSVQFEQVPIGDALTYISQRTDEMTAGKFAPNFVFNGTPDQKSSITVTMQFREIPVSTLISYVGRLGRCRIQYDEHAILVTPLDNISRPAAAAPKEPNPFEKAAPNPFQ